MKRYCVRRPERLLVSAGVHPVSLGNCASSKSSARHFACKHSKLADGTLAIFDYKSGKSRPQDWLEERPSNPQLLVYLRAAHAPVAALAAVHLTASRVNYRGIADRSGRLPKVAGLDEAWPQQLDRWRNHVEALAIDFLAGRAVLDPLGDACRRCHMHCFCRIADAVPSSDGAEQDD